MDSLNNSCVCVCLSLSLSPVTLVNGHHEWSEVGVLVSRSVHFGSLVQESATDLGMAVPGSQQQRIELHRQRMRERGGERERGREKYQEVLFSTGEKTDIICMCKNSFLYHTKLKV